MEDISVQASSPSPIRFTGLEELELGQEGEDSRAAIDEEETKGI